MDPKKEENLGLPFCSLTAVSPVDGRYRNKTEDLSEYFSEFALIRGRVFIEIEYLIKLVEILPQLEVLKKSQEYLKIRELYSNFCLEDAERIKEIEKTTNHDTKSVEYWLKEKFDELELSEYKEFIHFSMTSMDTDTPAKTLSLAKFMHEIYHPTINEIYIMFSYYIGQYQDISLLARTHGQPALPTKLGKEFAVFQERFRKIIFLENELTYTTKFGGAVGNFNAHNVAYPKIEWETFADEFIESLASIVNSSMKKMERQQTTTQIDHYDDLAIRLSMAKRINTILIDFARDMWTYISMDIFTQKKKDDEIGSSTMPQKINPIDFENAWGNLEWANVMFEGFERTLGISILQRDLHDSTIIRNLGVPFAHTIIAFKSLIKGMSKLEVNKDKIQQELNNNWQVVAEAYQTILRREKYPNPYEALAKLTKGQKKLGKEEMHTFIDSLNISGAIKEEMKKVTPDNYTGI